MEILLTQFKSFLLDQSSTGNSRRSLSRVSVKNYVSDVRRFLEWFSLYFPTLASAAPQRLSQEHINTYVDYLANQEIPHSSQTRYLSSLRRFTTFIEIVYKQPPLIIPSLTPLATSTTASATTSNLPSPIEKLLESFRRHLKTGDFSDSTVKNYVSDLKHFLTWNANGPKLTFSQLFTTQAQDTYSNYLKTINTASSTISRRTSTLKTYADFAVQQGILDSNPISYNTTSDIDTPLRPPVSIPVTNLHATNLYYRIRRFPRALALATLGVLLMFTGLVFYKNYNSLLTPAQKELLSFIQNNQLEVSSQGILRIPSDSLSLIMPFLPQYQQPTQGQVAGVNTQGGSDIHFGGALDQNFNLALKGNIEGNQLISTTTTQPPLVVASSQLVTSLNADLLDGYHADTAAGEGEIPAIDSTGTITFTSATPRIAANNSLTLSTTLGSDGSLNLSTDGSGTINALTNNTSGQSLLINNAQLSTGNLIQGQVGNNNTGFNFLRFRGGSTLATKFQVSSAGNVFLAGSLSDTYATNIPLADATNTTLPSGTTSILGALNSISGSSVFTDGGTYLYPTNRESLRVYNSTGSKYLELVHDGTDAKITLGSTTTLRLEADSTIANTILPSANNTYNLGSDTHRYANIYGTNIYQAGNQVCDNSGNCTASTGYWSLASGALYPKNATADLLIGGTATTSAKFAFLNVLAGTPTASISAGTTGAAFLTATGNLATTANQPLTIGGSTTGKVTIDEDTFINGALDFGTGNLSLTGTTIGLTSDTDLLSLADNSLTLNGAITITGTTTLNGLTYTWPGSQASNYILQTNGSGTLSWIDPGSVGTNYWDIASGAIYPKNTTTDLLIGATATTSAKFAFLNVLAGTPTASIAGTTANVSTFITGNGNLATTNSNPLTIGGSTTGAIQLSPNATTGLVVDISGNVGIGTTTPTSAYELDVVGDIRASSTIFADGGSYATFTSGGSYLGYSSVLAGGAVGYTGSSSTALWSGSGMPLLLGENGSEYVRILATSGNVGIGTTTPDRKLDVLDASSPQLRLTQADGTIYTDFQTNSSGYLTIAPSGSLTNITGNIDISGTFTSGTSDAFTIDASGRITKIDSVAHSIDDVAGNLRLTSNSGLEFTTSEKTYTWPTADGTANYVMITNGSGTLSFADPAVLSSAAIYWKQQNGSLFPKNSTVDAFIGGQATTSAKFAFLNVLAGTPTASIAGTTANVSTFITGNGNLATTNSNPLTIGGSTTGAIQLSPNASTGLYVNNSGNVGIGDTSPASLFTVGNGDLFQINSSGNIVAIGNTTHSISNVSGNLTIDPASTGDLYFHGATYNLSSSGDLTLGGRITFENAAFIQNEVNGTLVFNEPTLQLVGSTSIDIDSPTIDLSTQAVSITLNSAVNALNFDSNTLSIDALNNRVGIGITTPASPLSVKGTNGSSTIDFLNTANTVVGYLHPNGNGAGNLALTNAAGSQTISLSGDITSGVHSYINSGNFGIGTTSPISRLHVATNTTTTTGKSALVVNQLESQDIFAASASGVTRLSLSNAGQLRLFDADASNYTGFVAPSVIATNIVYTLPSSDGTVNQVLATNASGTLSWIDVSAGSGAGSNYWALSGGGVLTPNENFYSLTVGAAATNSAVFYVDAIDGSFQAGGAATGVTYSRLGAGTTGHSLANPHDFLITGLIEVDGAAYFDSTITLPNSNTLTGVANYTQFSNGIAVGGATTYNISSSGNGALNGLTLAGSITQIGGVGHIISNSGGNLSINSAGNLILADTNIQLSNGSTILDAYNVAADTTLSLTNSDGTYLANLSVEGQVRIGNFTSNPTSIGEGSIIYRSDAGQKKLYYWDGTAWTVVGSGSGSGTIWTTTNTLIHPINYLVNDFAIGGDSTTSAKFFVNHINGSISILDNTGTLTHVIGDDGANNLRLATSVNGSKVIIQPDLQVNGGDILNSAGQTNISLVPAGIGPRVTNITGAFSVDTAATFSAAVSTDKPITVKDHTATKLWDVDTTGQFTSYVANSASAVAFRFDTSNSLTTAGAKLLSIENANTEYFSLDKDGNLWVKGSVYADRGFGIYMKNVGSALSQYDLIVVSDEEDASDGVPRMSATVSAYMKKSFGVVQETCAQGATCKVVIQGKSLINVSNSTNRGDYLFTSTTAGQASAAKKQFDGLVGIATTTDATAPYQVEMVMLHQPAVSKLRVADKNRMHNDYRIAALQYDLANETNYYTIDENVRKGLFFDTFRDGTKIDSTNSTISIDSAKQRAGLAGGITLNATNTDTAGNTYLGAADANDVYYYDRTGIGKSGSGVADSSRQVQVELGIDPNWYNGVILDGTASATLSTNPPSNLSTTYNGGLIKASGTYATGEEDGPIIITIKNDNEATSSSPTVTFDWRTNGYGGTANHSGNNVTATKGTAYTLETGTNDITVIFTAANYHPGSIFKIASWYLEPATTNDRGSRQSFPERTHIIAGNTNVDIIDADSNKLWMRFSSGTGQSIGATGSLSALHILNGNLYVTHAGSSALRLIRFNSDRAENITQSTHILTSPDLANRNTNSSASQQNISNMNLITNNSYDVFSAVVPNQPSQTVTISGWGYVPGAVATNVSETVNLPYEFNAPPNVTAMFVGGTTGNTEPTSLSDCTSTFFLTASRVNSINKNRFEFNVASTDGGNFASSYRFCYTWTATGVISPQTITAVATDTGISTIRETSKLVNDYSDVTSDVYKNVWVTNEGRLYATNSTQAQLERWNDIAGDNTDETNDTPDKVWDDTTTNVPSISNATVTISSAPNSLYVTQGTSTADNTSNTIYLAHNLGLTKIEDLDSWASDGDGDEASNGSAKYYTSTYISEELIGNAVMMMPLNSTGTLAANTLLVAPDTDITRTANAFTTSGASNQPTRASGVRGRGITLDGTDDYICSGTVAGTCADDNDLDFVAADNFSISLWFKSTGTISSTKYLVAKKSAVTNGVGYAIYIDSNGLPVFGIDDDAAAFPEDSATTSTRVDDQNWHHIVGVKTGTSKLALYVDGKYLGSDISISATGTLANAGNFYLGSDQGGASYFPGTIDEPMVTVEELTAEQIKRMYEVGRRALQSHSINDYKNNLDEGSDSNGATPIIQAVSVQPTSAKPGYGPYAYIASNDTGAADDGYINKLDLNSDTVIQTFTASTDPSLADDDTTTLSVSPSGLEIVGADGIGAMNPGLTANNNNTTATYYSKTVALPDNISSAYGWVSQYLDSSCSACSIEIFASNDGGNNYQGGVLLNTDNNQSLPELEYIFPFSTPGNSLKFKAVITRDSTKDANAYIEKFGITWFNDDDVVGGGGGGLFTKSDEAVAHGGYIEVKHYQNTNDLLANGWVYDNTNWQQVNTNGGFATDSASTLPTSLVSFWKLDEDAGNRRDAFGNNELVDNATVTSNPGKQAGAAQFTNANSEYLSIADNTDLSTGNIDFSIGTWVYLDNKTTSQEIVTKRDAAGTGHEYGIEYDLGTDRFRFAVSNDGSTLAYATANNLGSPSTGTWYYIVAWHDAASDVIGIQVNNGTANTTAHSTGVLDGTQPFQIGAYDGATNALDGRVDEVGFWKKVLSSTEKANLYNNGVGNTYNQNYKIVQINTNTVRLYNYSGSTKNLRLDVTTGVGSGGSGGVSLAPLTADIDAASNTNSIWINKTDESGTLLKLQNDAVNRFTVGWDGNSTISGNLTVNQGIKVTGYLGVNTTSPVGPLDVNTVMPYEKTITITNSGSTLNNYQALIQMDTSTPIAAGKMQSNCNDLRFYNTDKATSLPYWIESGCNTTTTQIWVEVPSIPNGNTDIYVQYGNPNVSQGSLSWTGNFIAPFESTCPTGWSSVSAFNDNNNFPKGNAAYGGTGGSATHTHVVTGTSGNPSGTTTVASNSTNSYATNTHKHNFTRTSSAESSLPDYVDVVYCSPTAGGFPNTVTSTNYLGFFTSTPTGWTRDAGFDTKFPRANTTAGGTGSGAHAGTFSGNTGGPTVTANDAQANTTGSNTSHTHSLGTRNLNSTTNTPPYLDLIFANPDSASQLMTQGIIGIADTGTTPPMGWTRYSALDGKYPRGNSTSGGTGGSTTHSHSYNGFTTGSGGGTANTVGGFAGTAPQAHTHSYSAGNSDAATAEPPYLESVFFQKNTDSTSSVVSSETSATFTDHRLVVSATGKVGIGTSTPLWDLHVTSKETATATALIENTSNTGTYNPIALILRLGSDSTNADSSDRFINFMRGDSTVVGKIQGNGASGVTYSTTGADFAEYFTKSPSYTPTPGDVVSIKRNGVELSTTKHDPNLLGVISLNPGFSGGTDGPDKALVALTGQVLTNIASTSADIKTGDALTSSNIPGHAEKANRTGMIIGHSLEDWTATASAKKQILVRINTSIYDPYITLTDTGDLDIVPLPYTNNTFTLSDNIGQIIDRIGTYSKAVIANLKVGSLDARTIISPLVETDRLAANLVQTSLIKPQANQDLIISLTSASDSALLNPSLLITDASGSAVVSINNQGDATFSGTLSVRNASISSQLTADSAKFNTLEVNHLKANQIEGLEATLTQIKSASDSARTFLDTLLARHSTLDSSLVSSAQSLTSTNSSTLLASIEQSWSTSDAGSYLSLTGLSSDYGTFTKFLSIQGTTVTKDLFVENNLVATNISSPLDSSDHTLYIQPTGTGSINLLAGLLILDGTGSVTINGNLKLAGTFESQSATISGQLDLRATNLVSQTASSSGFGKLLAIYDETGQQVASVDASGSARFKDVATQQLIIAATNQTTTTPSQTSTTSNATIGTETILSGTNTITIQNSNITAKTLIYLTPISSTDNQVLYVQTKNHCLPTNTSCQPSFTVAVNQPTTTDIKFNYWLIETN